jgi:AAA domain
MSITWTPPSYGEIPMIPQRWLWYPWIARDVMTLAAGRHGSLKGTSNCELIARITTGRDWPDGSRGCAPGDVITITREDRPNEAMAYRLSAPGADRTRVWNLTTVRRPDGSDQPWELNEWGLDALRDLADKLPELRLIYIDPMLAVIDSNQVSSNAKARGNVVDPLDALCLEYGCGLVLVNHTVKDGSIAGSQGLVDAARLVLMYQPVRNYPGIKQLSILKSNIGPDSEVIPPLRYRQTGDTDSTRTVEWLPAEQHARGAERHSAPATYSRALSVVRSAPEPAQGHAAVPEPKPTAAELFQSLRRSVGSMR